MFEGPVGRRRKQVLKFLAFLALFTILLTFLIPIQESTDSSSNSLVNNEDNLIKLALKDQVTLQKDGLKDHTTDDPTIRDILDLQKEISNHEIVGDHFQIIEPTDKPVVIITPAVKTSQTSSSETTAPAATEETPTQPPEPHFIKDNAQFMAQKLLKTSGFVQDGKLIIILVTGFRTGSTFLGELFNQNPEVTYSFEMLHQSLISGLVKRGELEGVEEDASLLEKRTVLLAQTMQRCEIYSFMGGSMIANDKCGTSEQNMERFGVEECPSKEERSIQSLCKKRKVVALKVIRLQRIEHLELVPGIKNVNFKVIHLIRDPRGTMNSRQSWPQFYLADIDNLNTKPLTPVNMGIAANDLCTREMDNLEYSTRLPDWFQGRYLRITHDDMSLFPVESAEHIYKFVNLTMPTTLNTWLIDHTTSQVGGVLSTSKDSKAILEKWKSLELDIIRTVEEKCEGVMEFMGYSKYEGLGGEVMEKKEKKD